MSLCKTTLLVAWRKNLSTKLRPEWPLISIIIFGITFRVILATFTLGSNDMLTWEEFAVSIKNNGLINLYASNKLFNHPPLMGMLAVALLDISLILNLPFYVIFKLIMVFADTLVVFFIFILWRNKSDRLTALKISSVYSLNIITILLTGYHGNTDILYCLACLGAIVFLLKNRPFLSGLALAAGLNVKLIPLILIIPLLFVLQNKKNIFYWSLGLGIGALPLAVGYIFSGEPFIQNLFRYRPWPDNWGIIFLLRALQGIIPGFQPILADSLQMYSKFGPYIILAMVMALCIYNRLKQFLSLTELLTACAIIFLVFASGFGLQYLALPIVMVFTIQPSWGLILSTVTGISALVTYNYYLVATYPALSIHSGAPPSIAVLYLGTWILLVAFLTQLISVGLKNRVRNGSRHLYPSDNIKIPQSPT